LTGEGSEEKTGIQGGLDEEKGLDSLRWKGEVAKKVNGRGKGTESFLPRRKLPFPQFQKKYAVAWKKENFYGKLPQKVSGEVTKKLLLS